MAPADAQACARARSQGYVLVHCFIASFHGLSYNWRLHKSLWIVPVTVYYVYKWSDKRSDVESTANDGCTADQSEGGREWARCAAATFCADYADWLIGIRPAAVACGRLSFQLAWYSQVRLIMFLNTLIGPDQLALHWSESMRRTHITHNQRTNSYTFTLCYPY